MAEELRVAQEQVCKEMEKQKQAATEAESEKEKQSLSLNLSYQRWKQDPLRVSLNTRRLLMEQEIILLNLD